jgi:RHS repeat-associated protein
MPYGEEIAGGSLGRGALFGAVDGVRQRFTGQDRDSENAPSLDYFSARYLSSTLGRFMSPDPGSAGADITNPQSWNAYSYASGNPLVLVDPSGIDSLDPGSGDGPCGDDPTCGGFPFPPIGIPSALAPPPPVTVQEPFPPGSFPGGETLGLPPGMRIPGPFGLPGMTCEVWDCINGVGASGIIQRVPPEIAQNFRQTLLRSLANLAAHVLSAVMPGPVQRALPDFHELDREQRIEEMRRILKEWERGNPGKRVFEEEIGGNHIFYGARGEGDHNR